MRSISTLIVSYKIACIVQERNVTISVKSVYYEAGFSHSGVARSAHGGSLFGFLAHFLHVLLLKAAQVPECMYVNQ